MLTNLGKSVLLGVKTKKTEKNEVHKGTNFHNLGCARHNAQASLAFCSHLHEISELMCKHAQKENGLHDLLEIMIESMMVAERGEFLADSHATTAKVVVK